MPPDEKDYSIRWSAIKASFTHEFSRTTKPHDDLTPSQANRREGAVWQRRFWEHMIRDEGDFENHINYIHFNPVKHGLVENVEEWKWSTYHRYIELGWYPEGGTDDSRPGIINFPDEWN